MWNLKYDFYRTFPQNRNRLTDIDNRLVAAKGERVGRQDYEFGTSRCKLLHIKWMDKFPLYSTGNYI